MSTTLWIILAAAAVTYLARVLGHLVLSRFPYVPPRVQAGLDAVPAAVLTTLVAPAALGGGLPELAALAVTALLALRCGALLTFVAGAGVLIVLRNLSG